MFDKLAGDGTNQIPSIGIGLIPAKKNSGSDIGENISDPLTNGNGYTLLYILYLQGK